MSSMLREKSDDLKLEDVELAIQGNLCRCTGYRPIIEGFRTLCQGGEESIKNEEPKDERLAVNTFDTKTFQPYSSEENDPKFPKELANGSLIEQSVSFAPITGLPWYKCSSLEELEKIRKTFRKPAFVAGGSGSFKQPFHVMPDAIIQITDMAELQQVRIEKDGVAFGAGMTIAKMHDACSEIITQHPKESNGVFRVLEEVSKTFVSQQVRNIATIGGHLGWAHPCSDFIPIFMAAKCSALILNNKGERKMVALDDKFWPEPYRCNLEPGELILEVVVPFIKPNMICRYYRRARRKEFDLPIANAAFFGSVNDGTISNIKIVAGGMEGAFPGARSSKATLIKNTMTYLNGKKNETFKREELARKVFEDVFIEERAPGQFSNYRRCLVAVFAERFLNDISGMAEISEAEKRVPMKSHQLFEKPDPDQPNDDPVQRPIPHIWAAEQATGEARYLDDIPHIDGELFLVPVLSKKPHAKVKSVDFNIVDELPGIVGHLLPSDLPNNVWGAIFEDEVVLAQEVLCTRQMIAVLVCKNPKIGFKARKLVGVTYEDEKPFVLDVRDIKTAGEDQHIGPVVSLERDQGIKPEGKTVTIKGTVYLGGQEHLYMETAGALAIPSGEKDELTIWAGSQNLRGVQKDVSHVLGVPQNRIVVKAKRVGGGFGGKERMPCAILAAVAARKYGKPCRMVLSRSDDVSTTGHRHNMEIEYQATADDSGKVVDVKIRAIANAGISMDLTIAWCFSFMMRVDGGYTFKKFDGACRNMRTNTMSNTAFRGFGAPEGAIVAETMMEHLAHELGRNPEELRLINMTQENDMFHYGDVPIKGCTLNECWNEVMKTSKFEERKAEVDSFNEKNKVVKRGITIMPMKFPVSLSMKTFTQGGAYVRIYTDGSVLLSHGGIEMGQGLHTKMLQVCSRALGVPIEKIHSNYNSTDTVANATVTAASTGADINGPAVIKACNQIVERLKPIKEANPEGSWEEWVGKAYADCINLSAFGYYGDGDHKIDFDMMTKKGTSFEYATFGAGVVEVEVNCHTGDLTVLAADLVMDVGKSLNPAIDIGQIEGAFVQGYGYTHMEQLLISPQTGEFLTTGPSTYKVPTVADIPKRFNVTLLTSNWATDRPASAVYSSKGIGEPPLLLAMAVPIATKRALTSYRRDHGDESWFHLDMPMTSDKIRMACRDEYTRMAEDMSGDVARDDRLAFEI